MMDKTATVLAFKTPSLVENAPYKKDSGPFGNSHLQWPVLVGTNQVFSKVSSILRNIFYFLKSVLLRNELKKTIEATSFAFYHPLPVVYHLWNHGLAPPFSKVLGSV